MHRDIKEIVGALMRVTGGSDVTREEVLDLGFEAEGALQTALNEAYIGLLEFAHDRDLRMSNPAIDREMRARLQANLDAIVRLGSRHLV